VGRAAALGLAARTLPPLGWAWPAEASAQMPSNPPDPYTVETIEAFADTIIPGQKRSPDDVTIAGVVRGPGGVQAGAVDMWYFGPLQSAGSAPPFAMALNAFARTRFPATATSPPEFVRLDFDQRTELLYTLYDPSAPDRQFWVVGAAIVFLAFHTAGFLPTAEAVRDGHPGLAWLRFPEPDRDGLWRFPEASYRRRLNRLHPRTTRRGHPA
jgi:enediyne biosynthesis protein E8